MAKGRVQNEMDGWVGGSEIQPFLMSKLLKLKCFQNQKRISQICPVLAHRFSIKFCRSFWLCSFYLRPPLSNLPEQPKGEQESIPRFVLMHLPGKITYREIDEMIATVDKNEDWKISYSEFRVSFCWLRAETMYKRIFRTVLSYLIFVTDPTDISV